MQPFFFQDRPVNEIHRSSAVLVVVRAGPYFDHHVNAWLDTPERVTYTDQQPASGLVTDGIRSWPGPELHQVGSAQESAKGTGAIVHHAGGDHHQHGTVPQAAAHSAEDHGPPAAPEPDCRPGAALQVVRHANLHQGVHVSHKWVATQLQDKED